MATEIWRPDWPASRRTAPYGPGSQWEANRIEQQANPPGAEKAVPVKGSTSVEGSPAKPEQTGRK